MKMSLFWSLVVLCVISSTTACRPDPEIIEVPVPYAIDSLALLPQWENDSLFFGSGKQQWIGWADDSICMIVGRDQYLFTSFDRADWRGVSLDLRHNNEHFYPVISREWLLSQDIHTDQLLIHANGYPVVRTFLALSEDAATQHLSFETRSGRLPRANIGAFLPSSLYDFQFVVWARDQADSLGLLYVDGHLSSIPGNPIVDQVTWHPLPAQSGGTMRKLFLTPLEDGVLVGVGNIAHLTDSYGQQAFVWNPSQGYELIPTERYNGQPLKTAFHSADGTFSYLLAGDGDLYEVRSADSFRPLYTDLYSSGVFDASRGKDLRAYFAFTFAQDLRLLDKATGKVWSAPNLGLDGHNISDVTLFKDTLIISSRTGGIFYQALSDVWPEEQ